jgi:hypothetical protein
VVILFFDDCKRIQVALGFSDRVLIQASLLGNQVPAIFMARHWRRIYAYAFASRPGHPGSALETAIRLIAVFIARLRVQTLAIKISVASSDLQCVFVVFMIENEFR